MKYIVELKFINPSHEHVSLRRRVESVTRIVEAKNEDEAIRRAANQQRALGFMIQEAKIVVIEPKKPSPVIAEEKKEDKTEMEMEDDDEDEEEDEEEDDEDEEETDMKKDMKESMVADVLAARREKAQKKIADMLLKRDMAASKKEREDKRQAGTMKPVKEESEIQYIEEKLSAADPASKWISDFVASDNPKFAGKSKKERINMALGAYYAAKRGKNEEVEVTEAADPGKMRVVNKKVETQATKDTKQSEKNMKAAEVALKRAKGKKNPVNVKPMLDNQKV